jgi:hypothetical protein
MQGNSLRLRLTRSEVERLGERGVVEEAVEFGQERLTYRLSAAPHGEPVQADFRNGAVTVSVDKQVLNAWTDSDEVGIYARAGGLIVSIEKDFRCLTRPLDEQERDCYPNPAEEVVA